MRKALLALAVLSLATVPAFAQAPATDAEAPAATDVAIEVAVEAPTEATEALVATPAPEPVSQGYNYPRCSQVAGNACTQGQTAWCQWTPYEPELCWCNEGTFQCGSLH